MSERYLEQEEHELIDYMRATRTGGSRGRRVMTRRGTKPGFWEGNKNLIGSNLGEDWRQVKPTVVGRRPAGPMIKPGSGLDIQTRAAGRSLKGRVDGYRKGRQQAITDNALGAARESVRMYSDTWPDSGESPEVYDQANETPTGNALFPSDSGEVGPNEASWNTAFPGMRERISRVTGPGGTGGTRGSFG